MSPLFRQADFSFTAQVTSLHVIGFLDTQNEQICWLVGCEHPWYYQQPKNPFSKVRGK